MVKKLEDNNDVLNINETNSLNTNGTNGLASSYADSLKLNLKRKQHQTNLDSSNSSSERFNSSSTNDFNGNGLLNEFVVNVPTNLPNNISSKQQSTNSINHHTGKADSTTNERKSNSSATINQKSATDLLNNQTSSIDTTDNRSLNSSTSSTVSPNTATVSTLSTKHSTSFSPIKSNEDMEIDCLRSKIVVQITKDDLDYLDVSILIRNILKDTFVIDFQDQSLSFKFKTIDKSFLKKHNVNTDQFSTSVTTHRITNGTINGSSAEGNRFNRLKTELDRNRLPYFNFKIKSLLDKIIPNECSSELCDNELKIKLKKKIQIKWNGLEHVKNEMCVDYLNGPLKIQKETSIGFKPKNQNKNSNVERLVNGFEKTINQRSVIDVVKKEEIEEKKVEETSEDKEAKEDDVLALENRVEMDVAIPLPPPMPKTYRRCSVNDDDNNDPDSKDAENLQNLFDGLLTNPIVVGCKNDPDKELEPDEPEPKQQPILRLNLAELKNQRVGYTGLNNLGNTCYMNSCLQCLSSTLELRDYFLTGQYKNDLNTNNPFGSGGKLAEAFSEVLYKLWSGESSSFSPQQFKRLIDVNCSQFMGYSQHDSVEFMEHFLDVLHEDLNRVDREKVQPATAIENEDKLSDEQLANEQWKRHKERNDSIITELFYGQYKSKLVCPQCSMVSLTFDPFLYIPIPLTKSKVNYTLYLFTQNDDHPKRLSCKLPQSSKVINLLEYVASKINITSIRKDLIPCLIKENGELEQELRLSSPIPDSLGTKNCLKKMFIFQRSEENQFAQKFVIHQSIKNEFIRPTFFTVLDKCEFCNRPLGRVLKDDITWCKCNKVTYCSSKCLEDDLNLHEKQCRISDSSRAFVGWPSIFFRDLDSITYEEFMNGLEKQALNSVDVNEVEEENDEEEADAKTYEEFMGELNKQDEDKTKEKEQTNDDLHIGHEIKEGQLDLESKPEKEESNEKDDRMQVDQNEEQKVEENGIKESNTSEIANDEEKDTLNESQYRFVLRAKQDCLSLEKNTIYVPKDDSEAEQKKFRDCIRDYYYLYVDWKEKYSKLENGKRRTYKLSVNSKNLVYSATTLGDSSYLTSLDQEKTDCTLENLMTKFTEPETLSTQEAWVCPKCKEPRTASKELTIWKPPKILVIQLKRFSYSSYSRDKIDKFVQYPVTGLDLSKYCSNLKFLEENKPIYDLYAIIDHFGGLYGGHYTANANSSVDGKSLGWRLFNDSSVRSISDDSSVSRSAYVLFYRLNDTKNKTD